MSCKKSVLAVLLAMVLVVSLTPFSTVEAAASVRVNLPYFPVKINGETMDQAHSQYPFLYYKDVTYLPLTWNNLQALGLRYYWSEEGRLQVYPQPGLSPLCTGNTPVKDLTEASNSGRVYTAQLTRGPISVGAASIDNLTEPYPFLVFRNITYMPLTWRFTHDLLQMDIRWSGNPGADRKNEK